MTDNIMNIVNELIEAYPNHVFGINLIYLKPSTSKELPSMYVEATTPTHITVRYYLTDKEANEITKEELETFINMLFKQELYRRTEIFQRAILEE